MHHITIVSAENGGFVVMDTHPHRASLVGPKAIYAGELDAALGEVKAALLRPDPEKASLRWASNANGEVVNLRPE